MTNFNDDDISETPKNLATGRGTLVKSFKPGLELRALPPTPGFDKPGMKYKNVVRISGDKGGTDDH